ncbi:hypoxanthine-guanine phosphoribosyltransferase [Methylonatrum kenyense]|uniref:hypoxanthine-guanine phosphoribosyltransferase n=1 Tax=Methylonatrum kenyense TaxID=455253 RepID=UPI0020C01C24|nr:hypoxanthine-guanine phosphoribosyltransferase [Methylonatrum kenyense]MCK8516445.1 hypoxanthine-guanine phosphoribosyltransferase [Methylonatrum kenyense]
MSPEHLDSILSRAEEVHSPAAVDAALDRMADAISADYRDRMPLVLSVMIGGLVMSGRLLPRLKFPLTVDYLHASRYRGETRGGAELHWLARPTESLRDRSVLILDDILDEGHTLKGIIAFCRQQGARDVATAVLVRKRHQRRVAGLDVEYVGLEVPDRYVFGAGMDYRDYLRNLPGILALAPDDEEQA